MKKKIPLQVLQTIEPFVNKNGEYFISIPPEKFLLKFIDKDEKSDFYFNVEKHDLEKGFHLIIDFKPAHKQTTTNQRVSIKAEELDKFFSSWLKILEGYDNVKSVFDDPILEAFTDEYFTSFEIIDEDAEYKPFSSKHILLLYTHLEHIHTEIERYKTNDNVTDIQEICSDILNLQNTLTKKSKKWVIYNLSRIWGKISKLGPKIMIEILDEAKKIALQEGIKLVIEKSVDLIK